MHQSKLKRISLAVCLALMPFAASAAGLGKLSVISGLGEPLNAEIELLSTDADELATLTAAIAPEEAYSVQGIERTSVHSAIKVELAKKPDGSQVIKLTTRQPVSDPFLDMLIQVDWATGRLMREYTALLDPPGYTSQSSSQASSLPAMPKNSVKPIEVTEPAPTKIKSAASGKTSSKKANKKISQDAVAETKPDAAESSTGESAEYSTRRGDTLHEIATNMQVQGVSLDQMLIGLYRANKNAFDGNMNRLKVGQIIRAPSKEELDAISSKEATAEIRAQAADWNAYKNKLAGMVADTPAQLESKANQAGSGKITAKAEDKALPESTGPKDVVKLSKNDTGDKTVSANAKAMQDKLNSLQEEATAREKSVKEASERAAALEKQISDMQKLIAIKNQAMAEIQKNAAAKPEPVKAEPPKPDPVKVEPPKPVEATKPAQAVTPAPAAPVVEAVKPAPAVESAKPEVKEAEQAVVSEAQPKHKKKPATAPLAPPPPPEPEPNILTSIVENPLILGGIGGLMLILGAGWAFLRNKRKRNLDGFEQAILTSGGLKANTVFGNTAGGSIDTGSSFLTDFSQSGSGMIDTNDVDPIAEAEVYMAYGRDTQAEEILKDAISKEPKRYELHLKLLEILAARKDTSGFETIAGELYTTLGAGDPTWDKVADMGRKMEPDNPLYQMSAPTASAEDMVQNQKLDASEFETAEVMTESSLDFSLDSEVSNLEDVTASQEDEEIASLDFDIGGASEPQEEAISFETTTEPESTGVEEETESLDFNLDIGSLDSKEPEETALEVDLESTQTLPSFDMGDLELGAEAEPTTAAFDSTMPGLDMPDLNIPSTSSVPQINEDTELTALDITEDIATPVVEEAVEADISFDMPEINLGSKDDSTAEAVNAASEPEALLEMPDFDKTMILKAETTAEDIVFDSPTEEDASNGLDINFDLDISDMNAMPSVQVSDTESSIASMMDDLPPLDNLEMTAPPEIDLSGISLDLDEANLDDGNEIAATEIAESSEVDTKLDLVTAYIDMGDTEGARELIEEVLKEGGPTQRKRAEDLLASLG